MTKYPVFILAVFFIISIVIRIPNLDRPLSKHHEFNAAIVLNVCNTWKNTGGIVAHNFTPIIFFGKSADTVFMQGPNFSKGKNYYISMGPFHFMAPYIFFNVLGLPMTPLYLQFFAILLSLIGVIILYKLLLSLFINYNNVKFISLITSIIFIFLQSTLWFFSNAYCHESLALIFYLIQLYYVIKLIINNNTPTNKDYILLIFVTMLGAATDWFNFFTSGFIAMYFLIKYFKTQKLCYLKLAICIIISSVISVFVFISYYVTEINFQQLTSMLHNKFSSRSLQLGPDKHYFLLYCKQALFHFVTTFSVFGILYVVYYKTFFTYLKTKAIYFLTAPLLYSILLLEFTAENEYAMLKFIPFILIGSSYLFVTVTYKQLLIITSTIIVFNIALYYFINVPGEVSFNKSRYDCIKTAGEKVKRESNSNQVILTANKYYNYQALMYYANRNISFFESDTLLYECVNKNKLKNYYILQ